MFCKYCGKEHKTDVIFCSTCGKQLKKADTEEVNNVIKNSESKLDETTTSKESVDSDPDKTEQSNDSVITRKFCEECGEELIKGANFCPNCGKGNSESISDSLKPSFMLNTTKSEHTKKFIPSVSDKSRTAAALLAFFLGEFGAHRFYVGKFFSGIIQILFGFSFLIGLFLFAGLGTEEIALLFLILGIGNSIWIVIDFIMILCGSFTDRDNLPLQDWSI